jgi:hypothetical protein
MKKTITQLLTLSGFVAVLALATLWNAPAVLAAAIKAALVQNVDEPGRTPYQSTTSPTCKPGQACNINLSIVPAGKRLIATNLSGQVSVPSTTRLVSVVLHLSTEIFTEGSVSPRFFAPTILQFPGDATLFAGYIVNANVQMYFDAGTTPAVQLFSDVNGFSESDYFTLTGYLVDCTANCSAITP